MNPAAPTAAPVHPDTFPRWVLLCAGGLLAFTLIAVGLVRLTGNGPDQKPAPGTAERALRFEDRPDGSVAVLDALNGLQIDSIQGEAGFLRGALRAMARERRKQGLGAGPAFELIARADGRLTLSDPATGERIDLESFGPTNAGVFRRLLDAQPAR